MNGCYLYTFMLLVIFLRIPIAFVDRHLVRYIMPDFMKGLSKGIDKSKSMVTDSVKNLAEDMVVNPTVDANANMQLTQSQQTSALGGILTGIHAIVDGIKNLDMKEGDIVIPVYLGGSQIDEIVLTAQNRRSLRSGGRA